MNEAFERYQFPYSSLKKIFIPRVTEKDTDHQFVIQLQLDLPQADEKGQLEEQKV
ncbi:hypothetical protein L1N85_21860 [Paenibacillus alkaliterrae]|uniref:hypothetical protein n=1 Tax=Paenibacillus alkaliterrae TaxID=320909 RepID=UPI001F200C28|nr:hypothetical protein [Paenibacillus alkaliterrae]MCF2941036.1 hypothetical protein [Paenibacillus alkaliterrae]